MREIFYAAAAVVLGAVFTTALSASAQAAPMTYSRVTAEKMISSNSSVQKAGVVRRSARRTARRTSRRHGY